MFESSFRISKHICTEASYSIFPLDQLAAHPPISRRIVYEEAINGTIAVKIKMGVPYRVAFSTCDKSTEDLLKIAQDDDPVLTLTAADSDMLYVSKVNNAEEYFEHTFVLDTQTVMEGCLFIFLSAKGEATGQLAIETTLITEPVQPKPPRKKGRNGI